MANLQKLVGLVVVSTFLAACSSGGDASLSKDEVRNFKEGMSADQVKKIGPAPTAPSGPLKPYAGGSAADKASGR